jgi:phospholipase/carboxylesterase
MTKLQFFEAETLLKEPPKKLMVFLHGYGANGQDLISLAGFFKDALPSAHFISPNAPFKLENIFMEGYQWFSLENRDLQVMGPQVLHANDILNQFLDEQLQKLNLTRKDLILCGFSQGAMMAMFNALEHQEKAAAVIAYSGKLILPTMLGKKINSKPKICLVHGRQDDVVPFENFVEAEEILSDQKIDFESSAIDGLAHGINEECVEIGKSFVETAMIQKMTSS